MWGCFNLCEQKIWSHQGLIFLLKWRSYNFLVDLRLTKYWTISKTKTCVWSDGCLWMRCKASNVQTTTRPQATFFSEIESHSSYSIIWPLIGWNRWTKVQDDRMWNSGYARWIVYNTSVLTTGFKEFSISILLDWAIGNGVFDTLHRHGH